MDPIQIGLLGLGTVGVGTVKVLQRNADEISRRAGREIRIKAVTVRDQNKSRDCDLQHIAVTTDPQRLIEDDDIQVIVELMGGDTDAYAWIDKAIASGKHIVTANKALIAKHGNDLFAKAREYGVMVAFEGAVAGGIPIIKAIREGLAGNRIESIIGIINGTSNYILSRLHDEPSDFSKVLEQAQALGYAEADPTFDIEGYDIAHKTAILASIAFGIPLAFDQVHVEGIANIAACDIAYAKELGYRIKPLGITKRHQHGIEMRVHPTLISAEQTLAHVNGVMNALWVQGDAVGPTLYYGAGAGAEPTASAVVADLIDVVRTLTTDPDHRVPHLAFQPDALTNIPILPIEQAKTAYYLRLMVMDRPGVLAEITRILGSKDISIESILQKERDHQNGMVPVIIITHEGIEAHMQAAIQEMNQLAEMKQAITAIRLERL